MNIKVHHPKLLIFVLLGILLVGSAVAIYAQSSSSGSGEPAPFPAVPSSVELTPAEEQEVIDIVEHSGVVKIINGDQDWVASDFYRTELGGREAINLDATWEDPVTTSGPWTDAECQGTQKLVLPREFSNVTVLSLYVFVEEKQIAAVAVGTTWDETTDAVPSPVDPDQKVKVYEYKTGDLVYDGRYADYSKKCPLGHHDS